MSLTPVDFATYLKSHSLTFDIRELSASTHTAAEAAAALGSDIAQIGKSIVFRGITTAKPYLVVASGVNHIDEQKLGQLTGEAVGKAPADFVAQTTGYIIGGVPPFGHQNEIKTFIDQDLLNFPLVWVAAGSPHAVFSLTPSQLVDFTLGAVVDVC
jgi:prolyl-tRNA editing enzyme YbaK/EbsC (Cys-tRNA(Pro) deacylase)